MSDRPKHQSKSGVIAGIVKSLDAVLAGINESADPIDCKAEGLLEGARHSIDYARDLLEGLGR